MTALDSPPRTERLLMSKGGGMPKLTERQAAFCRNLVAGMSGSEAARQAGYKNAGRQAYQLLEKPHINAHVDKLRAKAEASTILDLRELQEWWTNAVLGRHPDATYRDQLKASEYLGKSQGGFTDRVESSGTQRIEVVYVDDAR